jgi:hypothetical protein
VDLRVKFGELQTKVLPALVAGTARQPLPAAGPGGVPLDALAALSLTGQALRFTRPESPPAFAIEPQIVDARTILPEPVRLPLLRLLRRRRQAEDVERALAWQFARLGLRPHPFDVPRMGGFVKAYAEELGPAALHWDRRDSDAASSGVPYLSEQEALDETNWLAARPAVRVRFVRENRRLSPPVGLELVRSAWAQEDAEQRLRLLEALQPELNEGDREFLDMARKDRGARVKSLAERMLYRLNGFTGEHPALQECLGRISSKTEGLLRKRTVLSLEVPATVKEHTLKGWIRETFAGLSCDELARGLDLSERELVEGAARDANLLLALALLASADRRLDLLENIVEKLPGAWEQMTQCGPMSLDRMTPEERARWAKTLAHGYGAEPPASLGGWRWMHRALRGPLPAEVSENVVRSSVWRDTLQQAKGPDWAELLAACCPATSRGPLRAMLGNLEPEHTAGALALLDILDEMEKESIA